MATSDVETLIEEIRASIGAIKHIAQSDILSIPFDTIARIENLGAELFSEASDMKKLRGIELEKLFVAGKINQ